MAPKVTPVFPFREGAEAISYPGSMNFDLTKPGKAVPAWDHAEFSSSADRTHYFTFVVEAKAPSGNPRLYAGVNNTVLRIENGTVTVDNTFASGAVIQGGAIVDDGTGTEILLVVFGDNGTINGNAERSLSTDTTPWTTNTGATKMTAFFLCVVGPNLYAATGSGASGTEIGRTVLGEHKVSVCPPGSDPTLAASWASGEAAGTPEWPITGMAAYRDRVTVAKGDGMYVRDLQEGAFRNVLDRQKLMPHAVNGKGLSEGENCVWYPTYDGKLYRFDGIDMVEETPFRELVLPRDVRLGRVAALADRGDVVAAVLECWQASLSPQQASAAGMKVITRIAGTYADVTSSVTNGDLTDGAAMATFGAAADDALYVGFDEPIEAVIVRVTRNANAVVQSFNTPAYSNGTQGTVAPFDSSFTALTGIIDGSQLGTAAVSLALTGFPASASEAVLAPTDIDLFAKFKAAGKTRITFPNGIGLLQKYWLRFKRVSSSGMTSPTTIDELTVVPGRPGLPITQANDFTGRDWASGVTHVLMGKRQGSRIDWADVYALNTHGGVWKCAWTVSPTGSTLSNGGPALVLLGRYKQMFIAESLNRDQTNTRYPRLVQFGTSKPGPVLAMRKMKFGDPRRLTKLLRVAVFGEFIQRGDTMTLYGQWDNRDDVFSFGSSKGAPAVWHIPDVFRHGEELHLWLTLNVADQSVPAAPYITRILVETDDVGGIWEFPVQPSFATPERA